MKKAIVITLCGLLLSACSGSFLKGLAGAGAQAEVAGPVKIGTAETPETLRGESLAAGERSTQGGKATAAAPPRAAPLSGDTPEAAYREAMRRIDAGDLDAARAQAEAIIQRFPEYQPARTLLRRFESPFSFAGELAERSLQAWLGRSSETPPFTREPPAAPTFPLPPVLTKGEFETTDQFNQRLKEARAAHRQALAEIRTRYEEAMNGYNAAVEQHNAALRWEAKSRQEQSVTKRWEYLNLAVNQTFGKPLLRDFHYDADAETFFGRLVSSKGNFDEEIATPVVLAEAPDFSRNLDSVVPTLHLTLNEKNQLTLANIVLEYAGKNYPAHLTDARFVPTMLQRSAGVEAPSMAEITARRPAQLQVKPLLKENRSFFEEAYSGDDPLY